MIVTLILRQGSGYRLEFTVSAVELKGDITPMFNEIITISGSPGSGKSTVAKEIAKKLGARRIYVGQIRRKIAKQKGMTLAQLNQYALTHPETDINIDKKVAKQARALAKKNLVIVEGRTQFYFIPESFKVYIKVSVKEGARRIWNQLEKNTKSKALRNEGEYKSLNALIKDIKARIANDKARYKKYYNIDHTKENQYDLVVDTTKMSKAQEIQKTLASIKNFLNK